jgi:hypothetical protein
MPAVKVTRVYTVQYVLDRKKTYHDLSDADILDFENEVGEMSQYNDRVIKEEVEVVFLPDGEGEDGQVAFLPRRDDDPEDS